MVEVQTDNSGNGAVRAAIDTARTAVEGEARSFASQVDEAEGAARQGMEIAHKAARHYSDVTKRLVDDGRRTRFEVANLWREGLAPMIAAQLDMQRSVQHAWRQMCGLDMMPSMRTAQPFASLSAAPLLGLPPTDVKETDQSYKLSVELPGLSAEDVELEITGDLLILRGHKVQAREDARAAFRLSERVFGQFERSFPIPPDADRSGVEAKFSSGLLEIDLPKQNQSGAQPSAVQIQS